MVKGWPRSLRFITCGTSAGKGQTITFLPFLVVGSGCSQVFALGSVRKSSLTFDTFQQDSAVKATTSCGQEVAVFAFLADRLVFLAGLAW